MLPVWRPNFAEVARRSAESIQGISVSFHLSHSFNVLAVSYVVMVYFATRRELCLDSGQGEEICFHPAVETGFEAYVVSYSVGAGGGATGLEADASRSSRS